MITTSSKAIICCGFTPCIQRILEFKKVEKGAVNRAVKLTVGIGGKGANTARMVQQLGGHSLLVGFVGGANGRLLEEMLDAEAVGYRHIIVEGETRLCQTLVEAGCSETTELVEEMPAISADNWNHMMKLFESMDLAHAMVPISGKLPAGAPLDAYAQICRRVQEEGGRVILDAPGEPLLRALEYHPSMVKINDVELLQTVGGVDLVPAAEKLLERGAQSVLITRGSRSAFFMDASQRLELVPPRIDALNAVGSGDAVTAGVAVEMSRGKSVAESIVTGMACGAANALNLVSGLLKMEDVTRLQRAVQVKPRP